MSDRFDVTVVGGGIAGGALSLALAREGLAVTVLEETLEFRDRVRGENIWPWGVREAQLLGLDNVLLDCGGRFTTLIRQYAEGYEQMADIPVGGLIHGVPGSLNVGHPRACQAVLNAAAGAGATVVRGVHRVHLEAGNPVTVSYERSGATHSLRTPLVIGADGRRSTVAAQAGITFQHQSAVGHIAGLLLKGLDGVPDDHDVVAFEGNALRLLFHQGDGRARAYVAVGESAKHRFAGRNSATRFLQAWDISTYPWSESVCGAVPAGPCATYPGDDSWTDEPYTDGVVLIGDAAGFNDPIIGQGLSIALRDARIVRDLVLDGAIRPAAFRTYARERSARMERLRLAADLMAACHVEDADNRRERRALVAHAMQCQEPGVFALLAGISLGPEVVPEEVLHLGILDHIRAAA